MRKFLIINKNGNELNPSNLFDSLKDKEDFNFCVTKERLEEIIVFSRNDYIILDIEEAKEYKFLPDDIVIARIPPDKLNDNESFNSTKFNNPKKNKNLTYWHRFIPPITRKVKEVKFKEIRNINKNDKELTELINNPVFIKYIHKKMSMTMSNFVGEDIYNAMDYSFELANDDEDMLLSPKVRMEHEFRCFVINKEIVNISPYIDYESEMNFDTCGFLIIKRRIKKFFKSLNIPFDKFPEMFVIDIFMNDIFMNGRIDIVEFNNYNTSGRYLLNDVESLIVGIK